MEPYDRDYDADFADTHQVPVEPMGYWGLSDRSRAWARQENRWGTSERQRRPRGRGQEWAGQGSGQWRGGDRDFEREREWHPLDRGGLSWRRPGGYRAPGEWSGSGGGGRRYDRDYGGGFRERDREWRPQRGPRRGYEADFGGDQARAGRGFAREYGRFEGETRGREDIPWDIDRPSLERPVPGYPRREASDAWGVYRPAWFGGRSPEEDRERNRGAWSYRAQRRGMYEATGRARPGGREGEEYRSYGRRPRRDWNWEG